MPTLLKMFNSKIRTTLFSVVLFLWAATSTILAMSSKSETVLIAIEPMGARVLAQLPSRDVDTEHFIRRFIGLTSNFNETTFKENLSLACDLMSDAVFTQEEPQLRKDEQLVTEKHVAQSGTISEIKRLSLDVYQIEVKIDQLVDQRNETFPLRVRLKLSPSERTTRNPWGIEVAEYKYERP